MEKRKIKFRAWDKRFKKMDFGAGDLLLRINKNDFSEPMQFTGLLDKNGKEIYEGDILSDSSNSIYAVEWEDYDTEEDFGNGLTVIGWNICRYSGFPAHEVTFEIIGNIYENPELLSKLK